MSSTSPTRPPRLKRAATIALIALAVVVCLVMGYWQITRWQSGGGTYQNLGYAFQWPLFAVFLIYAYRQIQHLDRDNADESTISSSNASARPSSSKAGKTGPQTQIPEDLLPPRPAFAPVPTDDDPVRADYNAYLAKLAKGESENRGTADSSTRS